VRVIWIDPGETVGWATADVRDAKLEVLDYGNTQLKRFALTLLDRAHAYDLIGFERYVVEGSPRGLAANVGSDVPTLQLVGQIRLAAWNAQRERKDGFPQLHDRTPRSKSGGLGALKLHAPPEIKEAVAEALSGKHDDGHYGDALIHLYGWYHGRFH
jgi:hypothetical protein